MAAPALLAGSPSIIRAQAGDPTPVKVEKVVAGMTLEQKLSLIGGEGMTLAAIPSIGLPTIKMSDGPVGVRTWGPADAYPAGIALAATWDTAIAGMEGRSLAKDAKARGVNVLLAPGVNIYRQPMNGRNFEYLGEDPYLTSRMAVAYIEGVQLGGVAATVKHFAGNNSEFNRHNTNSVIDERTLHEIYLPSFEAAVKEAHVAAVMDSYNLTNGLHMTENGPLNNALLKQKWGFDGVVMSDWNATYDGVAAANGELDLEMPRAKAMTASTLRTALEAGAVSQATIDDKVRRIVRLSLRYGTADSTATALPGPVNTESARQIAYKVATEGIVLLKNEGAVLPLDLAKIHRIALLGPAIYPQMVGGGGSSFTTALQATDLYSGMVNKSGPNAEILYSRGLRSEADIFLNTYFDAALTQEIFGRDGFVGKSQASTLQHVAFWNPSEHISGGSPNIIHAYRWTGTFTASSAGEYIFLMGARGRDSYKVYVDGKASFEHVESEGTGPESFVESLRSGQRIRVRLEYIQRSKDLNAGFGIVAANAMVLPEARQMAAGADAVIVSLGYGPSYESEGFDRTWHLPAGQDALVEAVTALNPKTIVVLNSGGGVDISGWVDKVPGLLHTWYGGEEGGAALRDIILGTVNPSGKLPISFERHLQDDAAFNSYYPKPGTRDVPYTEGILIGYRFFDQSVVKPLYPFGFGLSYTTFRLSGLRLQDDGTGKVTIRCDVRNSGNRAGDDVVQAYVGEENPTVRRPVKELKSFQRVHLELGQTKSIVLTLNARAFSYWDTSLHDWKRDHARFSIYVGDSSVNIPLHQFIDLKP